MAHSSIEIRVEVTDAVCELAVSRMTTSVLGDPFLPYAKQMYSVRFPGVSMEKERPTYVPAALQRKGATR